MLDDNHQGPAQGLPRTRARNRSNWSPRSTTAPASQEMRELLEEIGALQPTRSPCATTATMRARPSFSISRGRAQTWACASPAIPMGHEFTSLVLALLQAGGHPPKVERRCHRADQGAGGRLRLRDLHVSLSCHNCPDVVQALNLMAVLNPRIRHVAIDGGAVPGRGRSAPDHGRADGVPERRDVPFGPHRASPTSSPRSIPAPPRAMPPSSAQRKPSTC